VGDKCPDLPTSQTGEELDPQNASVIRTGDEYGEGEWKWLYGHDVTRAGAEQRSQPLYPERLHV